VLYGREFTLEDTLTLWDAIFAYDRNLILADYFAVGKLYKIRDFSILFSMNKLTSSY
jgi:hypothetical protein